jgi:hypothetical protein
MSNLKMIQKIQGWFDVKVYNDRQPREKLENSKADTDNIAFTATFDAASPEAAQFAAHGKPLHRQQRQQPRPRDIQDRRQMQMV